MDYCSFSIKRNLSVKEEISKGKTNIINEFKKPKVKNLEIFNDIELVEVEKKMTDLVKF